MATSAAARDRARADAAREARTARRKAAEERRARGELTPDEEEWERSGDDWVAKETARAAREEEKRQRLAYETAQRETKAEARAKAKARASSKTRRKAKTATKKVARKAVHPVAAARTGTPVGILAGTIGLAFFYLALTNAQAFARMVGGIRSALDWLRDPTTTITYKE